MRDLILSCRLVVGGGRSGVNRLLLMVFGLAVGVIVALTAATMPGVLHGRATIVSSREPQNAHEGMVPRFGAIWTPGMWANQRFTRVVVEAPESAPLPPGVSRLPGAGELVLSPAAQALKSRDPDFARLLDGRLIGTIAADGLTGPNELYAYIGADDGSRGRLEPMASWGGSGFDQGTADQFKTLPWQLALILAGPLTVYLTVCSRLSAAARRQRWAALSLLGMGGDRLGRIAGWESAVVGVGGAAIGALGYGLLNRWLGPSNVMGFTWYPSASRLSPSTAVVLVAVVGVVAAVGGSRAVRRVGREPVRRRFDSSERTPRWWYVLPFVAGSTTLLVLLLAVGREHTRSMSGKFAGVLVAAVLLTTVSLLPAVRATSAVLAGRLAVRGRRAGVRIAARRVESGAGRQASHVAGLCLLVLVSSIGSAILEGGADGSAPVVGQAVAHVNANEVLPSRLPALEAVSAADRWVTQRSITTPAGNDFTGNLTPEQTLRFLGVDHLVVDCATFSRLVQVALESCVNGRDYRLAIRSSDTGNIPAGTEVQFPDGPMAAPDAVISVPDATFTNGVPTIVTTVDPRTKTFNPTNTVLYFHLAPTAGAVDQFMSDVGRIAPAAMVNFYGLDLDRLETYRAEKGVLQSAIVMAFLLAMGAYVVSAAARAAERRRDDVALLVIGATRKVLRTAQRVQLLLPLSIALPAAAGSGWLAANALLIADHRRSGWYFGAVAPMLLLTAWALATAWLSGSFVCRGRLRAEDLRRE